MSRHKDMEIDPSQEDESPNPKSNTLQNLTTGPLTSFISKLSGSSRGIPSNQDFHFYYNFDEFKSPIKLINGNSSFLLDSVGASARLWGREMGFPEDIDEEYDWLVNVNDELYERFNVSVDEFRNLRKKEEESEVRVMSEIASENGFQLVYGKKKRNKGLGVGEVVGRGGAEEGSTVKVVSRDKKVGTGGNKPKVPFHIPTITRPQDEYKIIVNNSNQPFEHVWLQRSEDGTRSIHPLVSVFVFIALFYIDVALCFCVH
ncbi:unnamed protein product [Ilex paraguariensis]|uniref:Exosome-associated factor Rrp6 N-terminal domain-containing protein n=1 Tax=Ilex paraguariensis TaxID=185542 RepID=A0ABC8STM4_9AQUA